MGDKPVFRVGVAGLDPRDLRLIEIVFRHSHYNKYAFRLADAAAGSEYDLLIANVTAAAGQRAIGALRASGERKPLISALARGAAASDRHAISIDRLTLQLLPILNRVVELELEPKPVEVATVEVGMAEAMPPAQTVSIEVASARTPELAAPLPDRAAERIHEPIHEPVNAPVNGPVNEPVSELVSEPVEELLDEPIEGERPLPTESRAPGEAPVAHGDREEPEPAGAGRTGREANEIRPREAAGTPEAQVDETPEHQVEEMLERQVEEMLERQAGETGDAREVDETAGEQEAAEGSDRSRPDAGSNLVRFPASGSPTGDAPARLRVLVVDDSPTVRRQLTVALERLGLGCETVDSAARALERLSDEHFDLALVDVVMPDADGYKLTRDIKRDRRLRQMPVIILTSRSSPFDLARGALSGCDAYLSKPVPFRALEAAVLKQLRRSLAVDDLSRLMQSPEPGGPQDQPPRAESRLARLFRR